MIRTSANKLLLLDDEPNVLRSLERVLSQDGYDIQSFERPFDAIELIKCEDISVVIVDQCMPQMEGIEFLQQVTKVNPNIIAILLTGYDAPEIKEADRSPFRCLTKPWDDQQIRATVAAAFKQFSNNKNS